MFVRLFVCLVGTKMVVRAVAAVLTAEEQAMNPTPHPRQRRTRPGDWTYSEKKSDKEINVVTVECRKWFEIVCGFFSSVLYVKLRNLCQSINPKKANVESTATSLLVFSRAFLLVVRSDLLRVLFGSPCFLRLFWLVVLITCLYLHKQSAWNVWFNSVILWPTFLKCL